MGGQGGTKTTGGAGGTASGGAGGMRGTGGASGTGGAGGTAVDPDACPTAPQGKKCAEGTCNYTIDGKSGRCVCNNDFFVCAKLPAPADSPACPLSANQMRCPSIGAFCKVDDQKFCVCQQIGGSLLWSCL